MGNMIYITVHIFNYYFLYNIYILGPVEIRMRIGHQYAWLVVGGD